jgi:hypothetical protein
MEQWDCSALRKEKEVTVPIVCLRASALRVKLGQLGSICGRGIKKKTNKDQKKTNKDQKKKIGIKKKTKSRKHEKTQGNYHEIKAKPMDQKKQNQERKRKKERSNLLLKNERKVSFS